MAKKYLPFLSSLNKKSSPVMEKFKSSKRWERHKTGGPRRHSKEVSLITYIRKRAKKYTPNVPSRTSGAALTVDGHSPWKRAPEVDVQIRNWAPVKARYHGESWRRHTGDGMPIGKEAGHVTSSLNPTPAEGQTDIEIGERRRSWRNRTMLVDLKKTHPCQERRDRELDDLWNETR